MEEMYHDSEGSENGDDYLVSTFQWIKENDPDMVALEWDGMADDDILNNTTDEEWEELGRDISNNTHLLYVTLYDALNDRRMSLLFRGLTASISIERMSLYRNGLSAVGIQSMVPFLQNATSLLHLDLNDNNIQSEGFNKLLRALSDSQILRLRCSGCSIESIEIDSENKPKHLKELYLERNHINADGCRGLAKLLVGGDSTLTHLYLRHNKIDDEGVGILADVLQSNTSLKKLNLLRNDDISTHGQIMLLKLVNNISSFEATLQSNHTLERISVDPLLTVTGIDIEAHIHTATTINREEDNPAAAARAKIRKTQLHSGVRAELAELQGEGLSLYSEINPLHLPEVLSLVSRHHDQGELYMALRSSIAGVISSVNREQCLKQWKIHHNAIIAEHRAKVEAIEAELATIEAAKGRKLDIGRESSSNKRRKKSLLITN